MIEVKAPHEYAVHRHLPAVFLAGSIEMGVAERWQEKIAQAFQGRDILILNPRREEWNSAWRQSIDHPQFREQVEWELNGIDNAKLVIFYFAPDTKSPITLLELGMQSTAHPEKMIVCCPEGFWRKGNVDIVCKRFQIHQVDTLEDLIEAAAAKLLR